MSWSIMDFDSIRSFDEAERRYNKVKPIRGKELQDIRPMGDRRKQHARIVKIDDDTYACRMYETNVMTYHRDGRVELTDGGWDTQTTRQFMHACLPYGWGIHRHNGRTHVLRKFSTYLTLAELETAQFFILGNGTTMTINTKTDEIEGFVPPTKQLVNREATKAKRAAFMPFLKWVDSYMNVLGMEIPNVESRISVHEYLNEPQNFGEDKFIDILIAFRYRYWRFSYEALKKELYKEGTIYNTITLPVGGLQGR